MSNNPLHILQTVLGQSKKKRIGTITRVTQEILHIRSGKELLDVPYRTGYRVGQKVIISESNTLLGPAPGSGTVKVYVV